VGTRTDTGYFGRGFYFSAGFNTVVVTYAGGSGAVLLCKVLVGKDKLIPSATLTNTSVPITYIALICMSPLCWCRNRPYHGGRATI
jgi:hypothetical protein